MLEAFLSRGDRRLGAVIQRAWELGTKFDAWQDHHNHAAWQQAFAECGLEMDFYTHRPRAIDEIFPWDHIDVAVKKKFLIEDYLMSQRGRNAPGLPRRVFCLRHSAQVHRDAHGRRPPTPGNARRSCRNICVFRSAKT